MLELKTLLSRTEIPAHADEFLVYALISVLPLVKKRLLPVNLHFLVDAAFFSSDEGAAVNFAAVLQDIVANIDAESSFSVTVLKDTPKVYLPSGTVAENGHRVATSLAAALAILQEAKVSAGLSPQLLLQSLSVAAEEAVKNATPNRVNRIVYVAKRGVRIQSDSEAEVLLQFARKIRREKSQALTTLGLSIYAIGSSVNENLLIDMVDLSAGRYRYVNDAGMFHSVLAEDVQKLSRARVTDLTAELTLYKGVDLRRVHALGAELYSLYDQKSARGEFAPVMKGGRTLEGPRTFTFYLGDAEAKATCALLIELLAPPRGPGKVRLGFFKADAYVPFWGGASESSDIIVSYKDEPQEEEVPLPLKKSIAHCAALRAFQQAEVLLLSGDAEKGRKLLESSQSILQQAGEMQAVEKVRNLLVQMAAMGGEEWRRVMSSEAESERKAVQAKKLRAFMYVARSELLNLGLRRE